VALFICMVPGRCAKRLQIGHNSSLVHTQLSRIVLNVLLAGFEHGELLATRLARLGLTNILFAIPPSNTGVMDALLSAPSVRGMSPTRATPSPGLASDTTGGHLATPSRRTRDK